MNILRRTYNSTSNQAQFSTSGATFIRCLSSTYNFRAEVIDADGKSLGIFEGFGAGLQFETRSPFVKVVVVNEQYGVANASQEIIIAVHDGPIDDNRLVGQVNITGGLASRPVAPNTILLSGTKTATNTVSTFGMGGLSATQIASISEVILQAVGGLGSGNVFAGPPATLTAANGLHVGTGTAVLTSQLGGAMSLQTSQKLGVITDTGSMDVRYMVIGNV